MAESPFLTPSELTKKSSLAMVCLGRDNVPVLLNDGQDNDDGNCIVNTRFGSFPHQTLLNLAWGTQIVASNVGAAGRKRGIKRKLEAEISNSFKEGDSSKQVVDTNFEAAASGFAHVLIPTPESWTTSLPHRTQVVYTPDYSFILQRICARPGSKLIEAGAGSGSFTHASARAVFNGYPSQQSSATSSSSFGKVFSFEYHKPRFDYLMNEINNHGLTEIVHLTHRDVYEGGFLLDNETSPQADAIFLDLPAPWLALCHLTRGTHANSSSALNPNAPVHLCSFSPCIEQAQKTVSVLRELGWISVTMHALQHRRIDVRRTRVGLQEEGLRDSLNVPSSVNEAINRLRELETKAAEFTNRRKQQMKQLRKEGSPNVFPDDEPGIKGGPGSKQERIRNNFLAANERKLYKEGQLSHRTEPDIRAHTSYLVFAILPQLWTDTIFTTAE